MEIIRRVSDQQYEMPVYTTGDINDGASLMPGVTAETDLGTLILASGAGADMVGAIPGGFDVSELGSATVTTGLTWPTRTIKPAFEAILVRAEVDKSDTMALAGDESSKTITITSLENNIDTSYLYCVSGTGIGQLRFVGTSASGSCDIAVAGSPEWDTGDTCIKIPRLFHQLVKLNATSDKIGTDAAAGSLTVCVMNTWIERNARKEILYPPAHRSLSGLNASGIDVRFFVDMCMRNTAPYTID